MFRLLKLAIWLALIFGGIFYWKYTNYLDSVALTDEAQIISITPGETFQSILREAQVPESYLKVYLKQHTPEFELQVGSYSIPENATLPVYIESFETAISDDIELTFLEGWNIFDIDAYLSEYELIESGDFIEYSENYCNGVLYPGSVNDAGTCLLRQDFPFLLGIDSLEGYLYPDTYAINPNTFSVKTLSIKMLENFSQKIGDTQFTHEDVILASIVEKEEKNIQEKPKVAGILKKRLDEGWMLGADITVCYAHRLTSEQCKLSVTKYLYEQNEYNTRQKVGLPAGPIGNPSIETLTSTLYPVDTLYYYYLHDISTGKIYYGKTEAEHNRNKALYIR